MAKPSKRNPSNRRRNNFETVKVIALLVFIAISIGVVGGAVWYYAFFQPQSTESITAASKNLTQDYFNVSHSDITGAEGSQWMTQALVNKIASGDRVGVWKDRAIVSRIKGDVQVQILDQGLRSAKARVVFWQHEELDEEAGKEFLVYYDYVLVYTNGNWLVNKILTASEEGLKDLRKAHGVYDLHYAEEEEDFTPQ